MPSFMGVSGFLISCATCRAISRHALSRSLRANVRRCRVQLLHLAVVHLHQLAHLILATVADGFVGATAMPPGRARVFSRSNGRVVQLLMNTATSTLSAKNSTKRFTTATNTSARSCSC